MNNFGNKIRKRGKGAALLVVFFLLVSAFGSFFAQPAQASCGCRCTPGICPWDIVTDMLATAKEAISAVITAAKHALEYGSETTGLMGFFAQTVQLYNTLSNGMKSWLNDTNATGSMQVVGDFLKNKAKQQAVDSRATVVEHAERTSEHIAAALNNPKPTGADEYLCNVLKLRIALPYSQQFADMVADKVASGMNAVGRGPMDLSNGAQHAADMMSFKCGNVKGFSEPTGNDIDQFPEKCRAPVMVPGASTADREMSAESLSRLKVYKLPPVKTETVTENGTSYKITHFDPDPEDMGHRGFMMALQYCYTMGGIHPSPPYGAQKLTARGIMKEGRHVDCRSIQADFNAQCAARLGKLVKPDCSNDLLKPFCGPAVEGCAAAKEAHVELGPDYANCQDGLNLYQMERMSVLMCGASRRLQHEGYQGAREADRAPILTLCSQMKDYWTEQLMIEDLAFIEAQKGVMNNLECFVGTGK